MMYFFGAVFLSKPLMDHDMVRLLMMIILMSCVCLMWLCYFLPYSITVKSPFRRSEEKTFYNVSQPSNHARWSWLSSWCWLIQLDGINQFSNVMKGNRSPVIEWQFVFSARRKVSSPFFRSIVLSGKAVQYGYVMDIWYDNWYSILCNQYCYYDNIFYVQIYAVSIHFPKMNASCGSSKTQNHFLSHPISWTCGCGIYGNS